VTNFGQNTLTVTNITSSNPAFHVDRTSFSINYFDTVRVKLYYTAPSPGGLRTGTLTFTSNSTPPAPTIQLRAVSIGVANLVATPDTFYFVRLPGPDTTRASFRIRNPGTDTLLYTINETTSSLLQEARSIERSKTQQRVSSLGKGAIDPSPGEGGIDGQGGPDAFGYRWIDSDEPGGPTYNWTDISTLGTALSFSSLDDGTASVALPFTFRFYGIDYNTLNVCTNGFMSFTSTSTAYSNAAIPETAEPNAAVYGFWDDLNLTSGGTVYSYNDVADQRFVIQFTNVPYFSGTGTVTFQMILYANGTIRTQYSSVTTGTNTSCTVGIENETGTVGLQVVFNAAYLHNNLAILLTTDILTWTSVSPTSGVIAPGDSAAVELRIHPSGLRADTLYTGRLRISGNTPDVGLIRLGLRTSNPLSVGEAGEIPTTFALKQNYPNPFNPSTAIGYQLAAPSRVSLKVFDVLGREIATLVNDVKPAGTYDAVWDARNVASGLYFYRLEAGTFIDMKKMLLLK
jgi:hypothetical protein